MKTKEQKRKEAIERLERRPRLRDDSMLQEVWGKRLAEAKRLRAKFGLPPTK